MEKKPDTELANYRKNIASGDFVELQLLVPNSAAVKFQAMVLIIE